MTIGARPPDGPGGPLAALRGLVYVVLIYALMAVMGIVCLIPSMLSRDWALASMKAYCAAALWLLRVMIGTRMEYRGEVPQGPCIVASKHQSFLDIIALTRILPRPSFVMKKSLRWAPVIGVYAARLGSIPIDRSAGKQAVQKILDGAAKQAAGRQIIIYPQGTRVPPGKDVPYRPGAVRLYQQTGLPIALVAVNAGWFWPRTGIRRSPGTAVVEFLGIIEPGRPAEGLLDEIARRIEAASDVLAAEAAADLRAHGLIP